ncbi:uncharacterized protein TRIADDRAFT_60552 [Trichoplax adhaerens]|uniref:Uncharacterized protein n=1 Tax=Trichoplax adhaerens TaxID=10228 RepID=B3S8I4_TRIAD|nr:predicted protein [Trichoplax adhaerens]EDV20959.1 predicted protein [Trichoplax adhaerens]|eukprot:XP_002116603.1 predicted protein [Trichoplax adhaerens]
MATNHFISRYIVVTFIWLSWQTALSYTNQIPSDAICQLSVKDATQAYTKFKDLTKLDWSRVILFNMSIGNRIIPAHNGWRGTYFYAWIKKNLGEAIYTLPTTYIATSLSLYSVFISEYKLSLVESTDGCYDRLPDLESKDYILFKALAEFTGLNRSCSGKNCGTVCQRHFIRNDGNFAHEIYYSCCPSGVPKTEININECFIEKKLEWYVPLMELFSVCLSIILSGAATDKILNWFITEFERDIEIKSTRVRVLNECKLEHLGYFYLSDKADSNPWIHIHHAFKYCIFTVICMSAGFISIFVQKFPILFILVPKMYPYITPLIPHFIKQIFMVVALISGGGIFFILLADLRQFCKAKYRLSQQEQPKISQRYRYMSRNSNRQGYFQLFIYINKITHHLRSFHVIGLFNNLVALLFCLLFFIAGRVGTYRSAMFMTEILTIKLRTAFLPTNPSWRVPCYLMSMFYASAAFLYSLVTIGFLWIGLQLVFRVIITVTAFVVAYSVYFSLVIVIVIPYVHYIIQISDAYNKTDRMIRKRIIALKYTGAIKRIVGNILQANQGYLEVYVAMAYDDILIDLPEMLEDVNIRKYIKIYVEWMNRKPNHQIIDGNSKIIFEYKILQDGNVKVKLKQCINGCTNCPQAEKINHMLEYIAQYLKNSKIEGFEKKLTQIYYPKEVADADDKNSNEGISNDNDKSDNKDEKKDKKKHEDRTCDQPVAIPLELYQYLRYYAPQISISLWRVFFNIIFVSGLFFIFVLTVLLDYKIQTFSSLNSAIAKTPVIYVATILSLKHLKISELTEDEVDEILLTYIVKYRRGYQFFCTEGIHFQPVVQAYRMIFVNFNQNSDDDEEMLQLDSTTSNNISQSNNTNQLNDVNQLDNMNQLNNANSQNNRFINNGEIQFRYILNILRNAFGYPKKHDDYDLLNDNSEANSTVSC